MSPLPGLLNVKVLRGVNLVCRDATGSDPYVVLSLDGQVCNVFFNFPLYTVLNRFDWYEQYTFVFFVS
jgi:hypothetical protein